MDSDSSPNPIPIPKKHPFQTSLDLLGPSFTEIHSPPPRQIIDGNNMLLTNEGCITESSNIPNVIVTNEVGETLCEKEEKQAAVKFGESDQNSSSTEQCQTPLPTNNINPLSHPCNSAKQIKYQTKVMYERSVSWIKKVKLVLKDSPLLLFGLASKQTPTLEDVIEQSKIIFEDYLYVRLREAGFGFVSGLDNQNIHTSFFGGRELNGLKVTSSNLNPKPILSVWQKGNGEIYEHWHAEFVNLMSDVSVELHNIGMKLETTYPSLYKNVSSQVCISPVKNEAYCRRIIISLGDMMFKNGIVTWARIAAIFSLASAVAVECYHHKEPRLIETVMSSVSEVMEKHAVKWIVEQGGWTDVTRAYREMNQETRTLWALLGIGASFGFAFMWVTSQQW